MGKRGYRSQDCTTCLLLQEVAVKYRVKLETTDEGYAVWCPGLPGCWSQGATEEEALDNIKDAIETYLATVEELTKDKITRLVEVPV
jgi:predicted RNase H-like HicB family nuclease